jgi:hypothetical protein
MRQRTYKLISHDRFYSSYYNTRLVNWRVENVRGNVHTRRQVNVKGDLPGLPSAQVEHEDLRSITGEFWFTYHKSL